MNDFPTTKDLVYGNGKNLDGWQLDLPLVTPDGTNVSSTNNQEWYGSILSSVFAKGDTGMYVTRLLPFRSRQADPVTPFPHCPSIPET